MHDDNFQLYSQDLLKELHILTRDGKLNQDSRRKLKQIEHLGTLCFEQLFPKLSTEETFHMCDVGAGKNYFSFLLWDRYFRNTSHPIQIHSIESRTDLSIKSEQLAEKIGLSGLHSLAMPASQALEHLPEKLDLVVALHACDTATDEAIHLGLRKNARAFALVPCCQAEVAKLLEEAPKSSPHYSLWRHPMHRREFGSHLTNVIRCLYLEERGYKVRVTEFVGLEHSLKNEVIVAEKVQNHNGLAAKALAKVLKEFPLSNMKLISTNLSC